MTMQNETAPCCHHWVIQPANGPTSTGFCQKCFDTKEFSNTIQEEWGFDYEARTAKPAQPALQK